MFPPFDYFDHLRACILKQTQQKELIKSLPTVYRLDVNSEDRAILSKPISELVKDVRSGKRDPIDILHCYGKIALRAHDKTNCLTEIMLYDAERWIREKGVNLQGPLAGIPVSLKDSIVVGGFDASVGYSRNCEDPCVEDGTLVKILKAAGTVSNDLINSASSDFDMRRCAIRQDQLANYAAFLRICKRCLG